MKKIVIIDVIFLIVILGLSLWFSWFLIGAKYIDPGYPDWLFQAFRIRLLIETGVTSWTHMWSNGISVWGSYQFIPHVITAGFVQLSKIEITKAMLIIQIFVNLLYRVSLYILARKLKYSPFVGILVVLLSFTIGQYWSGFSEFTLQFGVSIFPFVVYKWIRCFENNSSKVLALISGLLWYVHPLAALYSIGLWITQLFVTKRLFSKLVFSELLIFIGSSALFIANLIFSKGSYTNSIFTSVQFVKNGMNQYPYFGIGPIVLILIVLSIVLVYFSNIFSKNRWIKPALFFSVIGFMAIIVNMNFKYPNFIAQTQFFRGVSMFGIIYLFILGEVLHKLLSLKNGFINGLIVVLVCLALVLSHDSNSPRSISTPDTIQDPVSIAINRGIITSNKARIWTDSLELANYKASLQLKFPNSYMTHADSSIISHRLNQEFLYPKSDTLSVSNLVWLKKYTTVAGIEYYIFSESSPYHNLLKNNPSEDFIKVGEVVTNKIFNIYKTNFQVSNSFMMSNLSRDEFPLISADNDLSSIDEILEIDTQIEKLATIISNPELSTPLKIYYPTPESIEVLIPGKISGAVLINESYSGNWKANLNGISQKIVSLGPNLILIPLSSDSEAGILTLTHSWSTFVYLGALVSISTPCMYILMVIFNRRKNASH